MAVPDQIVRNDVVAAGAGVTEQWIVHRTGVHERRNVSEGETVVTIATQAGRQALEDADVDAADLDLVLLATVAPDEILPNAAPLVATELGAHRAGAMDLGAACTGFLSALPMATAQVEGGRAEHVLVIGADVLSRFTDSSDRGTAALFADGAGAAVVAPANGAGGCSARSSSPATAAADPRSAPRTRSSYIRMQGHDTFKAAVQRMSEATLEAVERTGLELDDIDLFVYHQANIRILRAVAERLGLDESRVIDCIDRFGNTSSATLPIAMVDARERDARARHERAARRLRRGLHLGRGGDRMGAMNGRPEGSALVTGGSRGIGAAIAKSLAREGWPVGVNYRSDSEAAEAVVEEITERRRPREGAPGRHRRPRDRGRALQGARGRVRARARAGEQRRRARGRALPADRRRGLGEGDRHEPVGRLPADPPRPAPDDSRRAMAG